MYLQIESSKASYMILQAQSATAYKSVQKRTKAYWLYSDFGFTILENQEFLILLKALLKESLVQEKHLSTY